MILNAGLQIQTGLAKEKFCSTHYSTRFENPNSTHSQGVWIEQQLEINRSVQEKKSCLHLWSASIRALWQHKFIHFKKIKFLLNCLFDLMICRLL